MQSRRRFILTGGAALLASAAAFKWRAVQAAPAAARTFELTRTEEQWRALLSADQFDVLRRGATERPFSSPLNKEHRVGQFICAGCQLPLFSSSAKFDSGTGWPSFWKALERATVSNSDSTFGMMRTEVLCRRCGGHLGHVFDDGPRPTGLRYCIDGLALTFTPGAA